MKTSWAALALIAPSLVLAADKDDIYASIWVGQRFDSAQRAQGTVLAGYCPVDSIGVGVGAEQSIAYSKAVTYRYGTRVFGEARWFLEPFEASAGLGWRRVAASSGDARGDFVLQGSSAYLMALTASMAAKLEFQAQYAPNESAPNQWSGSIGAGLRFLY